METPLEKERLATVETQVKNISTELSGIWKVLNQIQDTLNKSNKTDWQTIFAGLVVVGALFGFVWGTAIHPINLDVERTSQSSATLAQAVVTQDERFNEEKYSRLKDQADMDKRIAIIEFQLGKKTTN